MRDENLNHFQLLWIWQGEKVYIAATALYSENCQINQSIEQLKGRSTRFRLFLQVCIVPKISAEITHSTRCSQFFRRAHFCKDWRFLAKIRHYMGVIEVCDFAVFLGFSPRSECYHKVTKSGTKNSQRTGEDFNPIWKSVSLNSSCWK